MDEVALHAHGQQTVLNKLSRSAAHQTGGDALAAQRPQGLGHIDALAARVQPQRLNAVHLTHRKSGDHNGFIQCGR